MAVLDFDLLDEVQGLADPTPPRAAHDQPRDAAASQGTVTAENADAADAPKDACGSTDNQAKYWWEAGYEAPKVKAKEQKRLWNRKTGRYEDVEDYASEVSSEPEAEDPPKPVLVDVDFNGLSDNDDVSSLSDILERVDEAIACDPLPGHYSERPVPERGWNPVTCRFEPLLALTDGREKQQEQTAMVPLPIEDLLGQLDADAVKPVPQETQEAEAEDSSEDEVRAPVLDTLPTTAEFAPWSKGFVATPAPEDRYRFNYLQRAELQEELTEKVPRRRAFTEASGGSGAVEKAAATPGRAAPPRTECLPGMRAAPKPKRPAAKASGAGEKPLEAHCGFSMFPGMSLPGDEALAQQMAAPLGSLSAASGARASDASAGLRAGAAPRMWSRRGDPEEEEELLEEALQSISFQGLCPPGRRRGQARAKPGAGAVD